MELPLNQELKKIGLLSMHSVTIEGKEDPLFYAVVNPLVFNPITKFKQKVWIVYRNDTTGRTQSGTEAPREVGSENPTERVEDQAQLLGENKE